ncbi:MAG: hypothetical protein WKF30_16495 [Pyrinomonadaceae bacterium]
MALVCGGLSLLSLYFIKNPNMVPVMMIGVGIAWASILSMPYAMLAGTLPAARIGVYMGVFNFFIVIPEIIQALTFGWLVRTFFGENNPQSPLYVVMLGGVFLLVAALCVARVSDTADRDVPERAVIAGDRDQTLSTQGSVQPVPSTGLIDE